MFSVIILAVMAILLLVLYCHARRSLPYRIARREELQDTYTKFAVSNQVLVLQNAQIQQFWDSTEVVHELFASNAMSSLRQELFDNAKRLQRLKKELNSGSLDESGIANNQREITDVLEWFRLTTATMDAQFYSRFTQQISVKIVLNECARLIGRSLRT